jgi:hypothetical protein
MVSLWLSMHSYMMIMVCAVYVMHLFDDVESALT